MRLYGRKLDGEWVLDEDGQVTDDPGPRTCINGPRWREGIGTKCRDGCFERYPAIWPGNGESGR